MTIDPNNLSGTATLTFNDDFNSLSLWNGTKGTWATDYWYDDLKTSNGNTLEGNGEQEWYINSNYDLTKSVKPWAVKDGIMTITAAPADPSIQQYINGYQYTSGEINTYHSFSQLYGYFEMRAQLPAGQGFWPAFWLLPEDGSWPPELDVMEVLGDNMHMLYTTVHTQETGEHTSDGKDVKVAADMSKGYHTYAVDWEPDYITWYFDNKQVYRTETPADMNKPMYMQANLAVGGYWPGNVDGTTPFPGEMKIDYIRAYQNMSDHNLNLVANGAPLQILNGGAGNDTLHAGDNSVIMTGNAGHDKFVFNQAPKNAGHIRDFTPGQDKVDVSAMLKTAGYTGTHPFQDGYLYMKQAANGNVRFYFDDDGRAGPHHFQLVTRFDQLDKHTVHLTDIVLPAAASPGVSLTANDKAGQVLKGTSGDDVLHAGNNSVVMTGGAGSDKFVFDSQPWNAGHITDFTPGHDQIDVSALLTAAHYHGSDPFGDGVLSVASDGAGGTKIFFDPDGSGTANPWPITLTTLDHVSASQLSLTSDFVFS
jgi:beta-glucanase (GH16 family)